MNYLFALIVILAFPLMAQEKRIVICGIAQNVDFAAANTIANIEQLGQHFCDYRVVIYENNSHDNTEEIYNEWANGNSRVTFLSEMLAPFELPLSRTERIAMARNKVLEAVCQKFSEYDYLIMADLDFITPWPVDEIINTINSSLEWDAVCANGVVDTTIYADRYAFRNNDYPFGPEVLGDEWWGQLQETRFYLQGDDWLPVYSAFGGLAIYKMKSVKGCRYSGRVNHDLWVFYNSIVKELEPDNVHLLKLLTKKKQNRSFSNVIITFVNNTFWEHPVGYGFKSCCEHIPFHAAMRQRGFNKLYVNPKMVMDYALFSPLYDGAVDHSLTESPVLDVPEHLIQIEFVPG